MTTERAPTITEIVEKWWFVTQHPVSDRIISTLEAREREVLAAAKAEAAASALEQATYRIRNFSEPGNVEGTANWVSQLSPTPNAKALWEAEARMAEHVEHCPLCNDKDYPKECVRRCELETMMPGIEKPKS